MASDYLSNELCGADRAALERHLESCRGCRTWMRELRAADRLLAMHGREQPGEQVWRDNWPELSTFYKYPEEIRRLIYTTNPMESFNRKVRKFTKTKGSFPTDDSLFKLLYLIVIDSSQKWTAPMHNWGLIVNQLRIYFGDRMDEYL